MGYYINPGKGTKEEFLEKHGTLLAEPPEKNFDGTSVTVCLVQNQAFSAAAIAYIQEELDYFKKGFANGSDLRSHKWYMIPVHHINMFMEGREII